MSSKDIPSKQRELVDRRDQGRCFRCGGHTSAKHHRRRRRVEDVHTHEPCNVISLCTTCHAWVHANPRQSRDQYGWIVSAHALPTEQVAFNFLLGWVWLGCDGTTALADRCRMCDEFADLEGGVCASCLAGEVCCDSAVQAAAGLCGCRGAAAESLRRLRERNAS